MPRSKALGRALERIDNPRAVECKTAAAHFREWIADGFGAAMVRSPLVQLRDHTWIPYVPCEARTGIGFCSSGIPPTWTRALCTCRA